MVFFVCETCNETLKKNQVEKHVYKCRNCQAVTCVDCSVTFYGNDYEQHITCVTEAEKHQGSLFKAKKVKLNPQDAWVALIEDVTNRVKEAPVFLQSHIIRLGELNNVPRNKGKFINFCKNSLKLYNDTILEGLWSHLDAVRVAAIAADEQSKPVVASKTVVVATTPEVTTVESSESTDSKKEKKSKKSKRDAVEEAVEEETAPSEEKEQKKKSKKSKREAVAEEDETVVAVVEEDQEESKSEKKKKSKKSSKD